MIVPNTGLITYREAHKDCSGPKTLIGRKVSEEDKVNKDFNRSPHEIVMTVKPPEDWKDAPDIKVTQLSQTQSDRSDLFHPSWPMTRRLIVTDTTDRMEPTHVTHREFSDWQDGGIPTEAQMPQMEEMILDALKERNKLEEQGCTVSWLDHWCVLPLSATGHTQVLCDCLEIA